MLVVGIDPGIKGGIAFLEDGLSAEGYVLPVLIGPSGTQEIDAFALAALLKGKAIRSDIGLVCVEREHAFPQNARNTIFSFGVTVGKIKAVLELLRLPSCEILPQTWKKEVLRDTSKDKQVAIGWVQRRYPGVDLKKCGAKPHDGIADAVCIAEYGRRQLLGNVEPPQYVSEEAGQ